MTEPALIRNLNPSVAEISDELQLTTEDVPVCSLCGSDTTELLFWNYDRENDLPGNFGILKCLGCDLVRLSPRPAAESIGMYYPEDDYYSYRTTPNRTLDAITPRSGLLGRIRDSVRRSVLQRLGYPVPPLSFSERILQPIVFKIFLKEGTYGWKHRFPSYVAGGRALDIGCGSATFLSFLKANGWRVDGIEISENAAKEAKTRFDIDVFVGPVSEAPYPDKSFSFVNMSHVLEHVYDPTDVLRKVRSLTTDDGTLYIEAPNYDSASRRLFGKYWFPWETPRHLYMFSPATLRKQAEAAGFEVIRLETKLDDQYAIPFRYRLEEKVGTKLDADFQLPFSMRAMLVVSKFLIHVSFLVRPWSGDFVCCWLRKKQALTGS